MSQHHTTQIPCVAAQGILLSPKTAFCLFLFCYMHLNTRIFPPEYPVLFAGRKNG